MSAKDGSAKTVLWTNTDFSTPEWIWAVGVDITARKRAEEELRYRSSIEAGIAKASSLLVSSDEIDYDTILQIMGESVSVYRAYIFQIQEGGRRMSYKFEWFAHGTAPQIDMLQDLETDLFPWWMGQLQNGKNIVIRNVDELPPEAAAEKEILQAQQVRSLIAVPIWSKGQALWAFMGFDDTEKTRDLSGTEIEALQIVGEIICLWRNLRYPTYLKFRSAKQTCDIYDPNSEGQSCAFYIFQYLTIPKTVWYSDYIAIDFDNCRNTEIGKLHVSGTPSNLG